MLWKGRFRFGRSVVSSEVLQDPRWCCCCCQAMDPTLQSKTGPNPIQEEGVHSKSKPTDEAGVSFLFCFVFMGLTHKRILVINLEIFLFPVQYKGLPAPNIPPYSDTPGPCKRLSSRAQQENVILVPSSKRMPAGSNPAFPTQQT